MCCRCSFFLRATGVFIHSMTEEPLPEDVTIAHQFRLDVPRIAFYANGQRLDSARTDLLWAYAGKWATKHGYDPRRIRHWCTQTALAPSYTRAAHALQRCDTHLSMHLVDDGQQSIAFLMQPGRMQLRKPFRIVQTSTRCPTPSLVQRLCLYAVIEPDGVTYNWRIVRNREASSDADTNRWGTTVAGLLLAWTVLSCL